MRGLAQLVGKLDVAVTRWGWLFGSFLIGASIVDLSAWDASKVALGLTFVLLSTVPAESARRAHESAANEPVHGPLAALATCSDRHVHVGSTGPVTLFCERNPGHDWLHANAGVLW